MVVVIGLLIAYLLGSIPVGYLVGSRTGIDLRRKGSGNVGATNAFRVLGPARGLLTLVGDLGKGLLATWLGMRLGGPGLGAWTGLAAIAGHSWSPFLRFQGGKGVATGAGAALVLNPIALLVALMAFLATTALTRLVSLGSIIAVIVLAVFMLFMAPLETSVFGVGTAMLVIYRHRSNIQRLLQGTESKLGSKPGNYRSMSWKK